MPTPGLFKRIADVVRYTITGVEPPTWFSPLQPLAPVAEGAKGRVWDYPPGYNLYLGQRPYEPVSFDQMRALADGYDVLRLVIETRKDQVSRMKWRVRLKDPKPAKAAMDAARPRIDAVTQILAWPDREHDFDTWTRALLEDLFVIDAPVVYVRPTLGGGAYSFDLLDGATIVRRINADGKTPAPPEVAYQQLLHGIQAVDFSSDELVYRPRNFRTNHAYGYSPVEQIIMTVNIGIRRQLYQLGYYTEGNIPDAFVPTPEGWTVDQIREFQAYWDELMEGNLAQRRHARFVPAGVQNIHETRERPLKDEYDEWLVRVVCFAFSVSPQSFSKMMNRATAETAKEQAQEEGLEPILAWYANLWNFIMAKYLGAPDLELAWEEEASIDPQVQSQIIDRKLKNGSMTLDEARSADGRDPYPHGLGSRPLIYVATGPVLLENVIDPQGNAPGSSDAERAGSPQEQDGREESADPAEAKGGSAS